MSPHAHATPVLECDIVMKGGITSGVIYPQAVAELAHTYRLRNVGGASAGAIAAAAAAAAELGRHTGGFTELDQMPQALTQRGPDGRSTLSTFFQPSRTAAPLFGLLHATEGKSGAGMGMAVAAAVLKGYWPWALGGALPGLLLIVLAALGRGPAMASGLIGGVLLLVIGVLLGLVVAVMRAAGRIAADDFGMCSGMPGVDSGNAPALTPWLHAKIHSLAGRGEGAAPVTFGDLDEHGVTLRVMTTNLTRHQPMAMPWRSREFFFDPARMRALFPADIVDWMEAHPPAVPDAPAAQFSTMLLRAQAGALRPWPEAHHVPIVVATRMSLSFPVLIQAVRLQAIDYTQPANRQARDAVGAWRRANPGGTLDQAGSQLPAPSFSDVWFTDGGLCSNLPVHFFDTPLPKHPTFAFNLGEFPPGHAKSPDQAQNSYLPQVNQAAMTRPWFGLPSGGVGAWGSFFLLMLHTARSWVDGEQLIMAGYRDRIVTIHHDQAEGGMNLNMEPQVVADLALRGKLGAAKLVAAFAGDQPAVVPAEGWDNHRWIRFRTSTAGLTGWLDGFSDSYRDQSSGGTPYSDLAGPGAQAPLPSYEPTVGDREQINARTGSLIDLADQWTADDAVTRSAPRPRPILRLVPDDGTAAGRAATGPAL